MKGELFMSFISQESLKNSKIDDIIGWVYLIVLFILEIALFVTKTNMFIIDFIFWISFLLFYIIRWKMGKDMKEEILDLPLLMPLFLFHNETTILMLRFIIIICMYFDYFLDIAKKIILDNRVILIIVSVISLQLLGGLGLMVFEGISFKDAQWLTFITSTTVGYGDIYAVTEAGRLITMAITIVGGVVYGALVITSIIDYVDYIRRKDFEAKLTENSEREDVSIVYGAFDRLASGEITTAELKEIVINELAKTD